MTATDSLRAVSENVAFFNRPGRDAEEQPEAVIDALGIPHYVLATESDPRLPARSLDMVFIAYAYHAFSKPEATMSAVGRSLKPGGRVFILEFCEGEQVRPASSLHKMSLNEIRREIEPLGFALDQMLDFLPIQHRLVFKKSF